jgi:septal ring factor EnvC (AmiA/AmiB activator)
MSLTEDDKKWLTAQFATKLDLERNLERFATKLDLKRVETNLERLETNLKQVETNLKQLEANLERVETNLLTEFHKWASPQEARQRTHTATLRAIDLEMEYLSDRIGKLEDPGRPQ